MEPLDEAPHSHGAWCGAGCNPRAGDELVAGSDNSGRSSRRGARARRPSVPGGVTAAVFVHKRDYFGRAVDFGQARRGYGASSHWNHVALARGSQVVQATIHGVESATLASLGDDVEVVKLPAGTSASKAWLFANAQIEDTYDWLSDICLGLDVLTPNWFPAFRRDGTWQCAALVAESLRFGGWLWDWPNIYTLYPAELYEALKA